MNKGRKNFESLMLDFNCSMENGNLINAMGLGLDNKYLPLMGGGQRHYNELSQSRKTGRVEQAEGGGCG